MIVTALVLAASLLTSDADLDAAKELYASASFDDALAKLDGVDTKTLSPEQLASVHQYRAACLFALGRVPDAEQAIEALVRSTPEFRADALDGSPRFRTLFSTVRVRVLPQVVQELYAVAKRAYAEKAPDSQAQFERVSRLLDDSAIRNGASASALADLRTVVDGFLDLSRAAAPARTAAKHVAADPVVIPPKAIRQSVPKPPSLASRQLSFVGEAAVEVTVSADGTVERAVMTKSINPMYDSVLLDAAKKWRYEPARRDGVPVSFVKTVVVTVKPDDQQ